MNEKCFIFSQFLQGHAWPILFQASLHLIFHHAFHWQVRTKLSSKLCSTSKLFPLSWENWWTHLTPYMSFYLSHSKLSDGLITQKIPLISRTDSSTLLGGSNSASMGGCSPWDPKPSPPQFLCTPDSQPALPLRFVSSLLPSLPASSSLPQASRQGSTKRRIQTGLTIALWWKAQSLGA